MMSQSQLRKRRRGHSFARRRIHEHGISDAQILTELRAAKERDLAPWWDRRLDYLRTVAKHDPSRLAVIRREGLRRIHLRARKLRKLV